MLGDAFALIREDEGVTLIRPGSGWARITLGVHSSLAAIGLTARVAESLAAQGSARTWSRPSITTMFSCRGSGGTRH
jgi:hypothetical protein